jgi:hypothetical protein
MLSEEETRMTTIKEAAYIVLKKAGRPLTISEITPQVQKIVSIHSTTPQNTVNNALQKHKKVIRVARSTFKSVE